MKTESNRPIQLIIVQFRPSNNNAANYGMVCSRPIDLLCLRTSRSTFVADDVQEQKLLPRERHQPGRVSYGKLVANWKVRELLNSFYSIGQYTFVPPLESP